MLENLSQDPEEHVLLSRGRGKMLVYSDFGSKGFPVPFDIYKIILNKKDPSLCLKKMLEESCHFILEPGVFLMIFPKFVRS